MEKVEEAAEEYAKKEWSDAGQHGDDIIGEDMAIPFIAGAEWQSKQSPWKIVANEPPPEYTDVLLSAGSRPDIFVGYFNGEDFRIRSTEETIEYFRVLHWMEIPK